MHGGRRFGVRSFSRLNRNLRPGTILRLVKLWPYARRRGYEVGQLFLVGAYCEFCGPNQIWLFDSRGKLRTTADRSWLRAHFETVKQSSSRRWFTFPKPWPPRLRIKDVA